MFLSILLDYRNKDLLSPRYVSGAVSLFVGILPGSCVMGYTVTDAVQDNNGHAFLVPLRRQSGLMGKIERSFLLRWKILFRKPPCLIWSWTLYTVRHYCQLLFIVVFQTCFQNHFANITFGSNPHLQGECCLGQTHF